MPAQPTATQFLSLGAGLILSITSCVGAQSKPSFTREFHRLPDLVGTVGFVECATSIDGWHWAYSTMIGNDSFVVTDGIRGQRFDKVILPTWSDGARHLYYEAFDAGKRLIVFDGKAGEGYDDIYGGPEVPRGTNHLAYGAIKSHQKCIVIDGKESDLYDTVGWVVFSPDGRHYAYKASKGDQPLIVIDGKPQTVFGVYGDPSFSPDSRHLSYVAAASRIGGMFHVIDGHAEPTYDEITLPVWIQNDAMVYEAVKGPAKFYLIDGVPHEIPATADDVRCFGKHVVYHVSRGHHDHLVIDGKAQPTYDSVVGFSGSQDLIHTQYAAKLQGKWFWVLDGVAGPPFDFIDFYNFVESPDGTHWAYWARDHNKQFIVEDGQKGPEFDISSHFSNPVYSPDGKHLAYQGQLGQKTVLVVDGRELLKTDGFIQDSPDHRNQFPPFFTPDGKHLIYELFNLDGKQSICIDGTIEPEESILYSTPFLRPDGKLEYLSGANNGRELSRVVISF